MSDSSYYLGKQGRVHGPYTRDEFERLLQAGRLQEYVWFWSPGATAWQPIDPPPPAPSSASASSARAAAQPRDAEHVSVLAHDARALATGHLERVTEVGCDFVAQDPGSTPRFSERSPITLDLLDPDSGRSMSVRARLVEAARKNGHWTYRLQWAGMPELL